MSCENIGDRVMLSSRFSSRYVLMRYKGRNFGATNLGGLKVSDNVNEVKCDRDVGYDDVREYIGNDANPNCVNSQTKTIPIKTNVTKICETLARNSSIVCGSVTSTSSRSYSY